MDRLPPPKGRVAPGGFGSLPELKPRWFAMLAEHARPESARIVVLALCIVAGVIIQVLAPQVSSRFIDLVVNKRSNAGLWVLEGLALLLLAATVGSQLINLAGIHISATIAWAASNRLMTDLARHCLRLDMGFHTPRSAGELIERIDGDISSLTSVIAQSLFRILSAALLIVSVLIALLLTSPLAGAALSTFTIAALLVLRWARRIGTSRYAAERHARASIAGFIEDRLSGLEEIRANGGGEYVMQRLDRLHTNLTDEGMAATKSAGIFLLVITNAVFVAGFGLALALGVLLFERGMATIGSIYLFIQYTVLTRQPLEQLGREFQTLLRAKASFDRVYDLRMTPTKIEDGAGVAWRRGAPSVEFESVNFAYDGRGPVLSGVSFRIEPGETVGLLGRTGSGKTTITRLLARLYDPLAGTIRLDGHDIREARLEELQAQVGVVTQDVQLFSAAVRDNLTLFGQRQSDIRLVEVLKEVGLAGWFARQPNGLDTELQGGRSLSAGEAQLLAFARVMLRDPGLLLVDEASSRLDPLSERMVDAALWKLSGRGPGCAGRTRTTIIVAHRLATVGRVDKIIIMDRGRIVELGDRAQLAANPRSHLAKLLRTSQGEFLE